MFCEKETRVLISLPRLIISFIEGCSCYFGCWCGRFEELVAGWCIGDLVPSSVVVLLFSAFFVFLLVTKKKNMGMIYSQLLFLGINLYDLKQTPLGVRWCFQVRQRCPQWTGKARRANLQPNCDSYNQIIIWFTPDLHMYTRIFFYDQDCTQPEKWLYLPLTKWE